MDVKKTLRSLSFPLMDDDALPSSYIQKVLSAIGKWRVKMHGMCETLESVEDAPQSVTLFLSCTVNLYAWS